MDEWSFINNFGKDIAKRAGTTTDNVWKALLGGQETTGPDEDGPKTEFTEDDMHGFSERLRQWTMDHPKEVATLIACIAAAPAAIVLTPVVIGAFGFGPFGPIAGKLYPSQ
jgi:hypothetical protein